MYMHLPTYQYLVMIYYFRRFFSFSPLPSQFTLLTMYIEKNGKYFSSLRLNGKQINPNVNTYIYIYICVYI